MSILRENRWNFNLNVFNLNDFNPTLIFESLNFSLQISLKNRNVPIFPQEITKDMEMVLCMIDHW